MPARRAGTIYRVLYSKERDTICEIHARQVGPSDMLGFIEVSDFVAPRQKGKIIRPDADRSEREFEGVTRTFIPISDIRRIDAIAEAAIQVESSPLKVVEFKSRQG